METRRRRDVLRHRAGGWLITTLLLALGPAAEGQSAGRVSGRVVDVTGEPLAGVELTLRGSSLPGTRQRVSGPGGRFLFADLPPGAYELRAVRDGYVALEQTGIRVRIAREVRLALELVEALDEDEVMLVGWAPGVDVTSTFGGADFDRRFLARLPVPRTFEGAVLLAGDVIPGLPGGLPAAGGASVVESRYRLDGLDTTDPLLGTPGLLLPLELVGALDVRTGGAPASHPGATGAVVDLLTRRGGEAHRGALFAHHTDDRLSAARPDGFRDLDGGVSLGGAVVPERLWYFGGVDLRKRDEDPLSVSEQVEVGPPVDRRTVYYTAKLTARPGAEHVLELVASGDPTTVDGEGRGADRETGGERLSASWYGPLGRAVRARLLAGTHEQRRDGGSASRDELRGALSVQLGAGRSVHELALGAEHQVREVRSVELAPRPEAVATARAEEDGVFVDTRLRLDAVTLSLGVRADALSVRSALGARPGAGLEIGLEDRFSPRLGLAWDVWGFNRSRLYAHHGRYQEVLPLTLPLIGMAAGLEVDPALETTFVRETRVGFEMEPLPDLTVGVSGVRRRTEAIVEETLVAPGTPRLTNPAGASRRHEAVELYLIKQLSGGWQVAGRYVYADSEGSWTGPLALPGLDPLRAHRTPRFDVAELVAGASGALPGDRRHRFTAYGSRRWGEHLTTGAVLSLLSGAPVSRLGGHPRAGPGSRFVVPRGSAGRTPELWRFDLRLAWPWEVGPLAFELSAALLNLTNERDAVRVDEVWTVGPGDVRTNPAFGEPIETQAPRTVRLGARLAW